MSTIRLAQRPRPIQLVGGAGLVPPNQLSGLTLWERSANISGSPIDSWANDALASGGGTFTNTGTNRPTVGSINGITAATFASASAQSLLGATALSSYITTTSLEGFIVVNVASLGTGNDSADSTPYSRPALFTGTTGARLGVSCSASGIKAWIFNGTTYTNTPFCSITAGTPTLIGFRLSAATIYVSVGDLASEVSTGSTGAIDSLTSNFRIGANFNGTVGSNSTIAEIVLYNRVLTTAERAQVRAYENNRFALGLTS